jgi:IclR family transcriptional regulator, KDG regulon repressor
VDAINKAFQIFELFLNTDNELSIAEIAKETQITTSTSHRIVNMLVKRGYLEQSHKRGKYSFSSKKLVDFSRIVKHRLKVRNVALPFMRELSQSVNEAVELSLRFGQIAYNSEVVNSNRLLNVTPDSATFNLYSTGVGKVFLAYMNEKELEDYLSNVKLEPRTPKTIIDREELKNQLIRIKHDGIAFDDEEHETGVRVVAAPVKDWDDNLIAAVGVVSPTSRMNKTTMQEIAPVVKKYADLISRAMGNTNV